MTRPEEIEGYEVPLHIALTQPILMGGAPRTFAILITALVHPVHPPGASPAYAEPDPARSSWAHKTRRD
jgi:hypothetical protein